MLVELVDGILVVGQASNFDMASVELVIAILVMGQLVGPCGIERPPSFSFLLINQRPVVSLQ